MPFQKLVSPSLTDLFVKQIEDMILSGELKPGDKLPTEWQLAANMNVSLAVVNGGINRLESFGFLRIAPRKGVYVTDFVREGNVHTLDAILEFTGNFFSPEVFPYLAEYRRVTETLAIRDAVKNCTEENLAALQALAEEFQDCRNVDTAPQIGYEYHHEMAISTGNVVYPLMLANSREIYIRSYEAIFRVLGKEQYENFFLDMTEHLRNRDEEAALQCFQNYDDLWTRLYEEMQNNTRPIR